MAQLQTVPAPISVLLELLAGRVQQVADAAEVRALILKGPFASRIGLRRRALSSDIDVLVEPGRLPDVVAGLSVLGWRARPADPKDDVFPVHSVSLYHQSWPIDIDVHETFPGLEAPLAEAFDALWEDRRHEFAAGVEVATTGVAGTVLILALNSLRSMWSQRSRNELDDLVSLAPGAVPGHTVLDLALSAGAAGPARPFLERAYPENEPEVWPIPTRLWYLYSLNPESASFRLIALREAPLRRRPAMLFRALVPSRAALASINLDALSMSRSELWLLRWRRLGRALRALPRIYRGYDRYRHQAGA